MLQILKLAIINWLGLATKAEVQFLIDSTVTSALKLVPQIVSDELDKDERTIHFNSVVNVEVNPASISAVVEGKIQDAIAQACRPGGELRK